MTYLAEDHSRDLLWGEILSLTKVLNLHHRLSAVVGDLEGPSLDILLDSRIVESATNQTPRDFPSVSLPAPLNCATHLISKIVLVGFIAAWFFAASPINRSSGVKETKDGVVKLPCSLATTLGQHVYSRRMVGGKTY